MLEAAVAAAAPGSLRAWVNNAGVTFAEPLHRADPDRIERTLAINLGGAIYGSRAALAAFVDAGTAGAIVNISSIHGQAAFPGWSVYDATKGGIDALTRSICAEYGHLGIRCNAIAPGAVNTEILATLMREVAGRSAGGARRGRRHWPRCAGSWSRTRSRRPCTWLLSDGGERGQRSGARGRRGRPVAIDVVPAGPDVALSVAPLRRAGWSRRRSSPGCRRRPAGSRP